MKSKQIAPTPPMGWNSWDCYGASVREEEVLANAAYMAQHLKPYGWEYVIVDIQWYEPQAVSSIYNAFYPLMMDNYSRLTPATNRFPSAASGQGFKPLADKIHAMGLKFGIHIMRGIPRQAVHQATPIKGSEQTARDIAHTNSICPWNTDMYGINPDASGAQAYYDSLFELYASWGVDYVKVDDIGASRLYGIHLREIEMIQHAIQNSGRDMVLSLSPGPAPLEHAEFLKTHANAWRMTDDYWDKWRDLYQMFERCEKWAPHVGAGNWPDCDMLPLGHLGIRSVDGFWDEGPIDITIMKDRTTRFTQEEQRTMMTLWCMFRSPLMFGGELRDNDDWTLELITNSYLLEMHRSITKSYQVSRENDLIIWRGEAGATTSYVALFNASEADAWIALPNELVPNCHTLIGIFSGETINAMDHLEDEPDWTVKCLVRKHGVALFRIEDLGDWRERK